MHDIYRNVGSVLRDVASGALVSTGEAEKAAETVGRLAGVLKCLKVGPMTLSGFVRAAELLRAKREDRPGDPFLDGLHLVFDRLRNGSGTVEDRSRALDAIDWSRLTLATAGETALVPFLSQERTYYEGLKPVRMRPVVNPSRKIQSWGPEAYYVVGPDRRAADLILAGLDASEIHNGVRGAPLFRYIGDADDVAISLLGADAGQSDIIAIDIAGMSPHFFCDDEPETGVSPFVSVQHVFAVRDIPPSRMTWTRGARHSRGSGSTP